ncbi:hypothetical protein FRC03_011207 [Tulasnella sp. 419]|nr:hypothetical protein FRC03_011207 [Tulasnella sp. 419]
MAVASAHRRKKSKIGAFFHRLVDWRVEDLFSKKRPPPRQRTIYVNHDLPPDAYDHKGKLKKEWVYTTNQVVTSKYTIITFIPRNLLEQFRRVANVFFALIAILQFLPEFSTISPGLVLLPLIVVLLITAGKDGYEDIKRHQSDRHVNHSKTLVLHGPGYSNRNVTGEKEKKFSTSIPIPVSLKGKNAPEEDAFAADIEKQAHQQEAQTPDTPPTLVVSDEPTDEPDDPQFIDPPNEDKPHWKTTIWEDVHVGDIVMLRSDDPIPADILIIATSEEENVAFVETKNLDGETNLKSRHGVAEISHLRTPEDFTTTSLEIEVEAAAANMYQMHGAVSIKETDMKHPIDLQTVLLRGTVVRNTRWCIGVVLYTGLDTKIVMNSGLTPSKRSKVERKMNPQVLINLAILAAMAVVCAIVDAVLETKYYPKQAPWMYGADRSDDNPRINGIITFANALITFQNVIPISLYISIEFVRTCQAAFIYFDHEIYYPATDTPTLARSWNLSDDLGQIEYIFSDKTGTLTQNAMIFRQCSIGGKIYGGDNVPDETREGEEVIGGGTDGDGTMVTPTREDPSSSGAAGDESKEKPGKAKSMESSSTASPPLPPPKVNTHTRFIDSQLQADLSQQNSDSNSQHARALNGFFVCLSLCHTVLASQDKDTGVITYKAQSPDEAALVQAAADVGFIFRGREKEIMRLQTPFADHLEEYELLNILDFTSARKRMSVLVRKLEEGDRRIFLLCKGADNVIFERLKPGQDELKDKTEEDLGFFASEGLRTLCLAYKVIPEDEYNTWADKYHDATIALDDRDEKIEAASDEIEQNLRLLGATAIEDKLQDGVPEAIADLKRAGIKVWVATGDKLETAIAIGHTTNLIARESNLIIVRGGEYGSETGKSAYEQMYAAIDEFFPESGILELAEVYPPGENRDTLKDSDRHRLRRMPTGASSIAGHDNGDRPGGFVLVIDGLALGYALKEEFSKELLLQLGTQCEAVICCRVSPKQKAEIVHLIKDGLGVMTLAIGDGANDVSMIQAADVGVGISGEEGLQAVNSSDYAIAQFRFLKRLLLVHGHWSYARNGNMIVNFFYKNIVCIGVLWWFQIYCGWSTTYVFEYTYLLFWNVFWSIAPVIAIGIFDRIIDDDILMAIPELYRTGREGKHFGTKLFTLYMTDGVYQSAVIFFLVNYAYWSTTSRTDGYDGYIYEFSSTMVFAAVLAVNLFNGLNTAAWTGWVWFAVLLGPVLVWGYTAVYSLISPGWFRTDSFGNYWFVFRAALFWLSLPLALFIAVLPRYVAKAYKFMYHPSDIDILRTVRKLHPDHDITNDPRITRRLPGHDDDGRSFVSSRASTDGYQTPRRSFTAGVGRPSLDTRGSQVDMATGLRAIHRGFDFSQEEGGVAIRRVQSRLSSRHQSRVSLHAVEEERNPGGRRGSISLFPNLRKSIKERKASAPGKIPFQSSSS